LSDAHFYIIDLSVAQIKVIGMPTVHTLRTGNLFIADAVALVNGFVRLASHLVMAPVERIANACDVAGLLGARRATWRASSTLYRAARREGHRSRRRGLFACLHYLSELT
jgi:hypothetical protein